MHQPNTHIPAVEDTSFDIDSKEDDTKSLALNTTISIYCIDQRMSGCFFNITNQLPPIICWHRLDYYLKYGLSPNRCEDIELGVSELNSHINSELFHVITEHADYKTIHMLGVCVYVSFAFFSLLLLRFECIMLWMCFVMLPCVVHHTLFIGNGMERAFGVA